MCSAAECKIFRGVCSQIVADFDAKFLAESRRFRESPEFKAMDDKYKALKDKSGQQKKKE